MICGEFQSRGYADYIQWYFLADILHGSHICRNGASYHSRN